MPSSSELKDIALGACVIVIEGLILMFAFTTYLLFEVDEPARFLFPAAATATSTAAATI